MQSCQRWCHSALAAATLLSAQAVYAAWPNLPNTPLAVQAVGDPNLLITLDDSTSMTSAYAPDDNYDDSKIYFLSPRYNAMAYDPFDVYEAPYNPNLTGARLTTTFAAAYHSGFDTARGSVNMSTSYRPVADMWPGTAPTYATAWSTGAPAFIYVFYNDFSSSAALPAPGTDKATFVRNSTPPTGCLGLADIKNVKCYTKVVIAGNSVHEQNFANWYSFYKTRNLAVSSSANIALYDLNTKFRVSWQTLGMCPGFNITSCKKWDGTTIANKLRPISDNTHRTNLFSFLTGLPAKSGTPLRSAAKRAGDFVKTTGIESPRANQLGVSETGPGTAPISACRGNFHVLLTDGMWNTDTDSSIGVANVDNTAQTLPDGTAYSPQRPFLDANSNSLADVAFQQWATDAQPGTTGLANRVQPWYPNKTNTNYWDPRNDPATWQHVNTYTIGVGLNGALKGGTDSYSGYLPKWAGDMYAGDYPSIAAGTINWPKTGDNAAGNVADLWHAAINGRGAFFGADSPADVKEAFRAIFARVSQQVTSSGQTAVSTRRVTSTSQSYDVKYAPGDWYGQIIASAVNSDGTDGAQLWTTDTTFTSDSPARNIFTWSTASGAARTFEWASFTAAEQASYFGTTALPGGDVDLLNYLRGNRSKESGTGAKFRPRTQLLGDIVGSDLLVSAKTDQGYQFLPATAGGSSYAAHVDRKKSVVFAGANDGMLHGFSSTGAELFAYVPSTVLGRLKNLSKSPVVWEPLVDGPLTLGDAYLGGAWKTILVGGQGGGGKAVYGLDVTNLTQSNGSGTFTGSAVLFEVTDSEQGYSFARPVVLRTKNGEWLAVWGNGYGGASARAMLFVYNLSTKTFYKVDTGVGSTTVGSENGLGSPVGVEFSPGNVVGLYAGDYRGNVWKFVLDSTGKFVLANGSTPFFSAKDASGNIQRITAPPEVLLHPAGGVMVLFGTGKFFEANDRTDRSVNSFYAVRDTGNVTPAGGTIGTRTRADLVQQTITLGTSMADARRALSTNNVDYTLKSGWFVDFTTTLASGTASGERVVARPVLFNDLVAFATYAPNESECEGAGSSYLMVANSFVGGHRIPAFDVNGDGVINAADKPGTGDNIAGVRVADVGGTLSSPIGSLVSLQPPGSRTPASPTQTCGLENQAPCVGPSPPAGCSAGLIAKSGKCVKPQCQRGNIWAQAANTGACVAAPDSKYPRWMELRWK